MRREVGRARRRDLLKVYDHFKPGVPEFAGAAAAAAGARACSAWDARRQRARPGALGAAAEGRHPHGGRRAGCCASLAGLKGLRRRGSRYALEQALIERWLAAVEQGTREHWALGHEIALCGRLIKGYGSTNERGKDNLLHVVDHLANAQAIADPEARAAAMAAARQAALADDAGRGLDAALVAHGVPPRPVVAQPIRWHRRPATPGKNP